MRRLLFVIFVIVPIIEIGLFILIGQAIGVLPTLLGVLLTAVVGALLVRAQGMALLGEIQATLGRGQLPGRAIGDAMLVGVAGVLMMTPGYFTDVLGLLLLIPPVRGLVYRELAKRLVVIPAGGGRAGRRPGPDTIDLDEESWRSR
jgi:UPF0716 protein FxsA